MPSTLWTKLAPAIANLASLDYWLGTANVRPQPLYRFHATQRTPPVPKTDSLGHVLSYGIQDRRSRHSRRWSQTLAGRDSAVEWVQRHHYARVRRLQQGSDVVFTFGLRGHDR